MLRALFDLAVERPFSVASGIGGAVLSPLAVAIGGAGIGGVFAAAAIGAPVAALTTPFFLKAASDIASQAVRSPIGLVFLPLAGVAVVMPQAAGMGAASFVVKGLGL